jgi:hypothetical protein
MSVAVVMPSQNFIHSRTVVDLTHLFAFHKYGALKFYNPNSPLVHQGRFMGVYEAMQDKDNTHVLFIDSDMTFPVDGLGYLLRANKPIVGCSYQKRDGVGVVGPMVGIDDGLVEADHIGLGFALIERVVFEQVAMPWFQNYLLPSGATEESEDKFFCHRAADQGYKTYVDSTLSYRIGHLGVREHRLYDD